MGDIAKEKDIANNCKDNYHRFTLEDRKHIETGLEEGMKLKDIAFDVKHDSRSVAYEIKGHRTLIVRENKRNQCGLQNSCIIKGLCNDCNNGSCKECSHRYCNDICPYFTNIPDCRKISRFPYVCNGCTYLKECSLPKMYYHFTQAQKEYKKNVTDFKYGVRMNASEMKNLDYLISQSIRNGHSISVALKVHNLKAAPSTIYSYIDKGLLSVKNIDLKRKIRYRIRKKKIPSSKIDYDYLKGRSYENFKIFFSNNPNISLWQLDTIEGIKGNNESAVMSLLYTKSNLQLFFKIKSITSEEITNVFKNIKEELGNQLFSETFEVILTDNGKEFKDPSSIERDEDNGEILTKIYYCEPRRCDEKGKCEKNHEHFREMLPKGISMNPYNQKDIDDISKMVNNYPRAMYQYHSPFEVSKLLLNEKVFKLNNLEYVSPDKVILKHLIKK